MTTVQQLITYGMSLNKVLKYCGIFKRQWYRKPKARMPKVDRCVVEMISEIRDERQFYGIGRITAELSKRLGTPVNRKLVRRAHKRMNWNALPGQMFQRSAGSSSTQYVSTRCGKLISRTPPSIIS